MDSANLRPAVVLVHGIWMNSWFVFLLGRRLRAQGFCVYYFSYWPVFRGLSRCVAEFQHFVQALPHHSQLHFVGHSLGGKLIWCWIDQYHVRPLGRVVTLGSPHQDCAVAAQLVRHRWGRWLLGRAQTLLFQSQRQVPPGWQWGGIAGNHALGLGRLLGSRLPAGDSAVLVEETRMSGMADHQVLAVSHSGLLLSPSVFAQVESFLRTGAFYRES